MARRNRGKDELPSINLTPIMSILVILVPILLYAFTFFEVRIQGVSAPRMGTGQAKKKDDEKKPLNLTVLITKKGFVIKQQAELTTEPEPKIFKRNFTITDEGKKVDVEEYDFPALYTRLASKKKQYPNERIVNIGADMDVPWHVIARTIDACRVQLAQDSYEDLEPYSKAKPKLDGKKEPVPMFDKVVFVVAE